MKIILKTIFVCVLGIACFSKSYAGDPDSIVVLSIKGELPQDAVKVGEIRVKDGGLKTNCGYEQSIFEAKMKASHLGGNLVKLTEVKPPDGWSTCYRLRADVYKVENISELHRVIKQREDSIMATLISDTASYALLYVYRPGGIGPIVEYNLHIDDTIVCRVFNNSKFIVRINDVGKKTIWARTEARDEVTVDIEKGKVYFLKCGVTMGAFVGHPKLNIVKAATGLRDFEKVKDRHFDKREKSVVP